MILTKLTNSSFWQSWGLLIARLIIAVQFAIAFFFKFSGIEGTAAAITGAGIPFALPLAWLAAFFEVLVCLSFLTGAWMRQAALLTIVYIIFLAFAFHGPSHFAANMDEFGFFVDHFVMVAGLLAFIAAGPGKFAWKKG